MTLSKEELSGLVGAHAMTEREVSSERVSLIASGCETRIKAGASAAPDLDADIASALRELLALRAQGGVRVKAWETRPQGEEVMEPSEIDVHEGAWAVLVGTNAKPIGWVDTHEMFKGRTYRDRMLPTPPPQVIEFITLQTVPQSNAGQHLTVSVRTADGREAEVIRSWGGLPDVSIYHTVTESGIAAALSALEASPAAASEVTEEMVQVPREPTEAMLDAYWTQTGESREMRERTHAYMRRYWAAMIAAALKGDRS